MPVKSEGFRLFSNEQPSSYPQNIAYKAAQMENQPLADRCLRRMREASAAEARQTNQTEVLIELAADVCLDIPAFIERLNDGSAQAAFEGDLRTAAHLGARGFPTFLVKYGEKGVLLRGYQRFETFQSVIKTLAGDAVAEHIPAKTEAAVLALIDKQGRVAPVEVQTAFDFTGAEITAMLDTLKDKRLIGMVPAGNGWFVERATSPMACDPDKGLCAL